jgi:hypothetical protein
MKAVIDDETEIPELLKIIADFAQAEHLVLCKNELFLQKGDGETISSIYPCNAEITELLGRIYGIPHSVE